MNGQLLYTTKEVFDSYLHGKKYAIPPYQRGYKWEKEDIDKLLYDIHNFNLNEDLDLFYCLQNITLVENPFSFNVVDGQQRLTTLTIILSYLEEFQLINEKLQYNVRQETEDFFKEFIFRASGIKEINTWDELLVKAQVNGKDYDYQDIYYIFNAYKTVQAWFDLNSCALSSMKDKILNHVKVIINLPKNIEEKELFENLNGKRVPLDGADLIRALIITRVAKKEVGEIDDTTKQNVLINEKRIKIGLSLDAMNLWWSDKNRQIYFRQFTKEAKVSDTGSISFNEVLYPINSLYKLYALAFGEGKLSMDFYEKKSTGDNFLQELQLLQRTLENWYNDRELYHLILFTSIFAGESFKEKETSRLTFRDLYILWKGTLRKDFIQQLKNRIAQNDVFEDLLKQVSYSDDEMQKIAFKESWFDNKLVSVSTLLDIISILSTNSNVKLPAVYFRANKEDLEHIFPQTPIGDRIKDKRKQTDILYQYLDIINKSDNTEQINIKEDEIDWDNLEWKESIKSRINDKINKIIPINSLGNMCVLHESVNRGYGNDFFLEKRIDIMRKSREGYFIRPHVYDAFNKIYLERQTGCINTKMMINWDKSDILARRKYIINQINIFLNQSYE